MTHGAFGIASLTLALLTVAACGGNSTEPSGTGGTSSSSTGGSGGGATGSCGGAQVTIAFFSDAACTAQVGMRKYDTTKECFSWTAAGSNAMDNSATRFQCYSDRLCYTQHPGSLTCMDGGHGRTDKEAQNGVCLKEPDGQLYSKLISGNEACPVAPSGFACPASASEMGTDGIVACTAQQ